MNVTGNRCAGLRYSTRAGIIALVGSASRIAPLVSVVLFGRVQYVARNVVDHRNMSPSAIAVYDHVARHRLVARSVGLCAEAGIVSALGISIEPFGAAVG